MHPGSIDPNLKTFFSLTFKTLYHESIWIKMYYTWGLLLSMGSMDWLMICLEVYNLKSLCFTSRSFLVCLWDTKKGVLAKK